MTQGYQNCDLTKYFFYNECQKYSSYELLLILVFIKHGAPKSIRKHFFFFIDLFAKFFASKYEIMTVQSPKNIEFLHIYCQQLLQDLNCQKNSQIDNEDMVVLKKYLEMYDLLDLFTFYSKNRLNKLILAQDEEKKVTASAAKHQRITFTKPFNMISKYFSIKELELDMEKKEKSNALLMPLFKSSRIINKMQQISNLRNQKWRDGYVLAINHPGHKIVGRRSYAILKDNRFQVWQKGSEEYPESMFIDWYENPKMKRKTPFIYEIKGQFYQRQYFQQSNKGQECSFKLSHRFIGHKSKITCAAFSSDQLYLITGSVDRVIKLWCLRLNTLLAQYKMHTKTIWSVHFNPSGYYFLSGSSDGFMVLWRTNISMPQRLFWHSSDVYKVSFCHDPNYVISGGQDGAIKLWQISDGKLIRKIKTQNPIVNFNLGHSGHYLLIIESDGKVGVHNLTKKTLIKEFYFFNNIKQNSKTKKKIKIHDGCFSEDEKSIVCITESHILFYQVANLTYNRKCNLYDDFYLHSLSQSKIIPQEIIKIESNKRLTHCSYLDFGLLLVGTTDREKMMDIQ